MTGLTGCFGGPKEGGEGGEQDTPSRGAPAAPEKDSSSEGEGGEGGEGGSKLQEERESSGGLFYVHTGLSIDF
jgi:hypothetical protein